MSLKTYTLNLPIMKLQRLLSGFLTAALFATAIPLTSAEQTAAFTDVPSTHPNYEAINNLKFNGVIEGYPDGTFKPDKVVNRVEVLKMVLEGLEVPEPSNWIAPDFSDVDLFAWYGGYLQKAYTLGMVEGYADGTFKPDQTVNLVENLKLLVEAADVEVSDNVAENPFNDAPKDEWYAKYVQYAKDKNLVEPDQNFNIYPAKGMTRGDFAETLYRLRTVIQKGLDTFKEGEKEVIDNNGKIIDNQPGLNVRIENFAFMPKSMTIGKGTKVTWTNYDDSTHTVTGDGWDSGNLQEGDTYSKTFNELGTFNYDCSIHPAMTATIIVKPPNEVPSI